MRNEEPKLLTRRSTLFFGLSLAAFSSFLVLLALVRAGKTAEVDLKVTTRIQKVNHPILTRAMGLVSWMGFQPQSMLLPSSMIVLTYLSGAKRDARYMLFAWCGSLISYSTKKIIKRPRPNGENIIVAKSNLKDTSFPSGHTLSYTVFWGFFSYVLYRRLGDSPLRFAPPGIVGSLIALVGPSRLYLGHHWLTDVLASYSLGTGYLMALIGIYNRRKGKE